jgi:flagellar hook-basal body complex protein FliE
MEIQPIQMQIPLMSNPIQPIAPISVSNHAQNASEVSAVNFKDLLNKAISDLNTSQTDANTAIQNLATGGSDNLHDVIISMEKAEMTLQYAIQVRNKVMDAYQSVIQMQV